MLLFYNDANLGNRDDRTFFALLSGGFLGEESLHVKPCQLVVTKPSKVDLLDKVRHTIRSMGVVPCQLFLQCLSVFEFTTELIYQESQRGAFWRIGGAHYPLTWRLKTTSV